jgi:hypothetical protein
MAITISTTTINEIDAEYPVAGVDNDSQGFRDNFSAIKSSLSAAAADLATLNSSTAKLNANNDFNGNNIQEANFIANTEEVHNNGNLTAGQNISFTNGHYQTVGIGGNITLTLADWPATGKLGRMRVVLTKSGAGASYTVTWSTEAGGTIKTHSDWPAPFTVTSNTDPKVVDFWTDNGGVTVYAYYVGDFD